MGSVKLLAAGATSFKKHGFFTLKQKYSKCLVILLRVSIISIKYNFMQVIKAKISSKLSFNECILNFEMKNFYQIFDLLIWLFWKQKCSQCAIVYRYLFRSNRMANLATESVVVDGGDWILWIWNFLLEPKIKIQK